MMLTWLVKYIQLFFEWHNPEAVISIIPPYQPDRLITVSVDVEFIAPFTYRN